MWCTMVSNTKAIWGITLRLFCLIVKLGHWNSRQFIYEFVWKAPLIRKEDNALRGVGECLSCLLGRRSVCKVPLINIFMSHLFGCMSLGFIASGLDWMDHLLGYGQLSLHYRDAYSLVHVCWTSFGGDPWLERQVPFVRAHSFQLVALSSSKRCCCTLSKENWLRVYVVPPTFALFFLSRWGTCRFKPLLAMISQLAV